MPARAVRAALPATLSPELATLVSRPPSGGDWLYEIKFDGYRMLVRIGARGDVRVITRRGNDWTARFPALVSELRRLKLPEGWYDGELVALDAKGLPDFNRLQNAIEGRENAQLVMFFFDAPYLHGWDLRDVAVQERRALLAELIEDTDLVRFSREIATGPVQDIVATACRLGLEGVIGKRRGSPYVSQRSEDWIKLKCTRRQEFVIGGYTWPDASRSDAGIGSLLVGQYGADGQLHYSGKVGTGYTGEVSADLRSRLDAIAQRQRPFAQSTGHDTHATWVRPQLVCEVAYNEWPEGGSLRHASFKGLREDKAPPVVTRERAKPAMAGKVRITHGSRVIDAASGLTKLDLASYYAQVAPWLLPHVLDRPLYVARFPEGVAGQRIFQQHPEGVKGFQGTDPKLWPGHEPAIAIASVEDLVAAAQMDVIEFHGWNSTAQAIDRPDRIVFDIDPGEDVPWPQVREAALLVRALLDQLGLQSWLKTTGGKGLHVFVPLAPDLAYAPVKAFSQGVVQHLARTLPQRFVAKSGARNRIGRVYIDYQRNGPAQSTAEAFSARARPGLGVSMPIAWDELTQVESGAHWNISNAIDHLSQSAKDPWGGYWKSRQSLADAIAALG